MVVVLRRGSVVRSGAKAETPNAWGTMQEYRPCLGRVGQPDVGARAAVDPCRLLGPPSRFTDTVKPGCRDYAIGLVVLVRAVVEVVADAWSGGGWRLGLRPGVREFSHVGFAE